MGRIIVPTQTDYFQNVKAIRDLTWEGMTEEIIPTSLIDSIAILHSVEDRLIEKIPDAINPNHKQRADILRYVIYGSAIELIYIYPQLISKSILGNREQYADIMEGKITFLHGRLVKVAETLGIEVPHDLDKKYQPNFEILLTDGQRGCESSSDRII